MKTSILSALIAAALALSATSQDCNPGIALGMTFADVAAALGQPVNYEVSDNGVSCCYLNANPISVSNDGAIATNHYSAMVMFDSNGRVSQFQYACRPTGSR